MNCHELEEKGALFDPDKWLDHPLNKAAMALLKRHGGRKIPAVMPVLELTTHLISSDEIISAKGLAYFLASLRDPDELLPLLVDSVTPADLIEAGDPESAGDLVLQRLMKIELADFPEFRATGVYWLRENG